MKQVYLMEGLTCANCAAKIEDRIRQMEGIQEANYSVGTQKMHIVTDIENMEELTSKFQSICDAIEEGVTVKPFRRKAIGEDKKEHTFLLKGLTCANCAGKIEEKIKTLPHVSDVTYAFSTQQLRLTSNHTTSMLCVELQGICDAIEEGVTVEAYKRLTKAETEKNRQETKKSDDGLWTLIIGGIILLFVSITEFVSAWALPKQLEDIILVITYIILAYKILWTAIKNIGRGQIFDENLLMGIATIGALLIGEFPEAVGVIFFYRIGEMFEHRATERSRNEIMTAVDMRPQEVRVLTDAGNVVIVNPEEVEVGQIIEVRPGDLIPLDGTIIEGTTRVNTAPVTGEPVPIAAEPGTSLLSGCVNESGRIVLRVDNALNDSMVTKILDSVENAAASKPKIDRFITRFARVYTPIVVVVALITGIIPPLLGFGTWDHWIYTALTFLVISCPCALVLSVPLAFFSGIGAASKRGILLKGGLVIEALSNIKAVALDKTGTITTGEFAVQSINPVPESDELKVLTYAAALEVISNHPIAISVTKAAKDRNVFISKATDTEEIPGEGLVGIVDGKQVCVGNVRLMERYQVANHPSELAPYCSEVLVGVDGQYIGNIRIADSLREDSAEAIRTLKSKGIESVMLTGDNQRSADYIASQIGISAVKAQLLPQDKLSAVKEIRQQYGETMFVGDGINDAPVLAGADVGGAMGSGADAAIEASDVVFMRSSLSAISDVMGISKHTVRIAWQNVAFAIAIKIIIMALGLAGYASMWWAVFGDTGVSILCILNSVRILYKK